MASLNVSNLPVNFDLKAGALDLTLTSRNADLAGGGTDAPFAHLKSSAVNCEKASPAFSPHYQRLALTPLAQDKPCSIISTVTLLPEQTSTVVTDYLNGEEVTVDGFGTIDGKPNISLPELTAPAIPASISLKNVSQLIDDDCDAASGLCFGNGLGRIENFDVLGATIEGGDISIPCVFGEGICASISPAKIQELAATTGALAVNLTLALNDSLPFLENLVVEVPAMSLDVDIGDKENSVTLAVEPLSIVVDNLLERQRFLILSAGSINDWSAVFRAAYVRERAGAAPITPHPIRAGTPSPTTAGARW
jgi:hypothetical protein